MPAGPPEAPALDAAAAARRGTLLVAVAAVCWSSGGLLARLASTDPWTTTFWRGVFAAAFLSLVVRLAWRRSLVREWRAMGAAGLGVALFMAGASTCFILALSRTSVANVLVLMSIGPFVAGLLGWAILDERVAGRTWAAMAVASLGTVVMVSSSWATGALAGDLLALAMAASFAAATVLVRRRPDIRMAPAAALATATMALAALPLADPVSTSARDIGLLALFGAGQFGAGMLCFTAGARLIPAARSSLIGLLETVLGPIWVWLALGEVPTATTLLGGALILGALVAHTALEVPGRRASRLRAPARDEA